MESLQTCDRSQVKIAESRHLEPTLLSFGVDPAET
jgi:hypothetical protein